MIHGYFASLPPDRFPNTVALADALVARGPDERFESGWTSSSAAWRRTSAPPTTGSRPPGTPSARGGRAPAQADGLHERVLLPFVASGWRKRQFIAAVARRAEAAGPAS